MEINVFGKYKVKRTNNYSYISDRIGEEYYFDKDKSEQEKVISGGELMEWIANDMKDWLTISVNFSDNEIFMEHFNPNTGESGDILYTIESIYPDKEVKDEANK